MCICVQLCKYMFIYGHVFISVSLCDAYLCIKYTCDYVYLCMLLCGTYEYVCVLIHICVLNIYV